VKNKCVGRGKIGILGVVASDPAKKKKEERKREKKDNHNRKKKGKPTFGEVQFTGRNSGGRGK